MAEEIVPRNEPEVMFAKGRAFAEWCNERTGVPYENIYVALELAEQAHEVHGLPYKPGLSNMSDYPPNRFVWFCDEAADPKQCVKLRDNKTERVVTWPHWRG